MVPRHVPRPTRSAPALVAVALAGLTVAPAADAARSPVRVTADPVSRALTTKDATARVTVRNGGKRRLTGLKLTVGARKGVRVRVVGARGASRTRALPALRAGKRVAVRVRLRRTRGGPKAGRVTVRVRQKGRTVATTRLSFGPRAAPTPTPSPAPAPAATLTGRYFWGSLYTVNGIDQRTLLFTGSSLVRTSAAEGSWPVCAAASEDCRPYAFDPATNALVVDGVPATFDGRRIVLDGLTYTELGAAAPGARWDVVLTYSNSTGLCPLSCSYFTEYLAFRPDGTFIRSAVSSGTGPGADWSVVPPDSKGTYEVRADRTLRLAFADGKERIETLGVFPADDGTYPANPTAGIVLDGDGYFDIS
ncbi:hypothetical protein [Patulibacter sp. SYSU D01012]|uniref:hypothetical protein n=1 Tax=Patulibacter sp. SYSU D01012 TaxID=2817381 RepID=UPI001B314437|nr:hypothetical protein [Patulibacter sp. SYSU D01012]